MAEWNAGRMRVSLQDDGRSLLLTGTAAGADELVSRLQALGLTARTIGSLVVACGNVAESNDGTFTEFGDSCRHQTLPEAARHAVHRLSALLRELGIEPEPGEGSGNQALVSSPNAFGHFSFGAQLC